MTDTMTQERDLSRVHFDVDVLHCASCVANVQRAIEGVPGVVSASVNLTLRQAAVETALNPDYSPNRSFGHRLAFR
ncbi:MAG: heavy-metal-associated domain-containing protein [Planctomycetia bacterium]|nr:heavy-metal-associated domain-containing protein [Planctomycetia bacterium]